MWIVKLQFLKHYSSNSAERTLEAVSERRRLTGRGDKSPLYFIVLGWVEVRLGHLLFHISIILFYFGL